MKVFIKRGKLRSELNISTERKDTITLPHNESSTTSSEGIYAGLSKKYQHLSDIVLSPERIRPYYYAKPVHEFIKEIMEPQNVVNSLKEEYRKRFGVPPKDNGLYAWESSAVAMAGILREANLKNAYVVMEYCLPSNRRADFLIIGKDKLGRKNIAVVEDKQWERANMEPSPHEDNIRIQRSGMMFDEMHPSIQAESYGIELFDFLEDHGAQDEFLLSSFAYLHNIHKLTPNKREVLFDPKFDEVRETTPLYTAKYKKALMWKLKHVIGHGGGSEAWKELCELQNERN